jgi:hypothetical protein
MIRGDPPLGPGAPPAERLAAFYAALVDLLETHGHLALATEVGSSRYRTGAYGFWRTHVRALAHEAGAPDPDVLTDVLLAPLAPDLYRHQRETLGYGPARIGAALADLARAVLRG